MRDLWASAPVEERRLLSDLPGRPALPCAKSQKCCHRRILTKPLRQCFRKSLKTHEQSRRVEVGKKEPFSAKAEIAGLPGMSMCQYQDVQ